MLPEEPVETPWRDPIVEEIHRIRREHAARFNYEVAAIVADARQRQHESGHKVVSLPPRRVPATDRTR